VARLKAQGGAWSQDDLLRLLKLASEAPFPMRDSPQPLIHIEAAVVQMATLEPGDTLAELLQRLESLERRLAGGQPEAPAASPTRPGAPVAGGAAPRNAAPAPAAAAAAPRVEPAPGIPPRSAATATLERDERVEACWREAIAATNLKKRMLGAFLEESRLVGLGNGELVVAMDDLHRTVVEEKENRALVVEAIARAFNRPLGLKVAPLAAAGLTPPAPVDYRPLVDQAIAWFQGDPIERPGPPSPADPRRERNAR